MRGWLEPTRLDPIMRMARPLPEVDPGRCLFQEEDEMTGIAVLGIDLARNNCSVAEGAVEKLHPCDSLQVQRRGGRRDAGEQAAGVSPT